MSGQWSKEELQKVSEYMKKHGWMTYEEFCKWLENQSEENEEKES